MTLEKSITLIFIVAVAIIMVVSLVYYAVQFQPKAYIDGLRWERSTILYNKETKQKRTVTAAGENKSPYWPSYKLNDNEIIDHTEQKYIASISVEGERPFDISMSQTEWEQLSKDTYISADRIYSL